MNMSKNAFFEAARRASLIALACLLAVFVSSMAYAQQQQYAGMNNGPRYTGINTGLMGHLTFEGGGGFTPAAGGTANNVNVGWNILLGTGYMVNKRFGVLAEWNFNRNAIPQTILNTIPPPSGYSQADVGGNYHFWTAMLDPIYNYWLGNRWGGYLVGGGGFSRKLVSFTVPVCGYGYGGYGYGFGYGFGGYGFPVCGNAEYDHFSSNQAAADLGTGLSFRFSPYNRTRLFMEARFVKLYTSRGQIPGSNAELVPVVIGIRW